MRTAPMDDQITTPDLPLDRRCRCGRRVLRTLTTTFSKEITLDPDPAAAGLYRLTPGGLAEAVGPGDWDTGVPLYSPHACARTQDDAEG